MLQIENKKLFVDRKKTHKSAYLVCCKNKNCYPFPGNCVSIMVIIEAGDPGSPQTEVTCAIETPLVLQEPQSDMKTAVIQSYVEVCCCYPQ